MTTFKKNDLRCPVCLTEYNSVEMARAGIKHCPTCKTGIQPLLIANDGYIRVNWQDLRVLAAYSRRWAETFDIRRKGNVDAIQALENILFFLSKFRPKNAQPLVPDLPPILEIKIEKASNQFEDELWELKPDPKTGLIKSPFYRRLF